MESNSTVILFNAFQMMAEWIRKNPPADLGLFFKDPELLSILAGGSERDPQGYEYMKYFLEKAQKKNKED
jgi:hypothetical protein